MFFGIETLQAKYPTWLTLTTSSILVSRNIWHCHLPLTGDLINSNQARGGPLISPRLILGGLRETATKVSRLKSSMTSLLH